MATPDPTAVKAAAADARTALAALIAAADAYGQANTTAGGFQGPTTPQVVASVVLDVIGQAQHTSPAGDITVLRSMQYARKNVVRLDHPVVNP
ncbi:hypothetical protein [Streptomyces sp. NPDC056821]|uniref:hypothetical protein n=1 Tax=unclassified Streptomyces TaxID=2593676 RepID=UPI0036966E6F